MKIPVSPLFSLCTACKGRLVHLEKTLPISVSHQDAEVILVDYSCPNSAGQWAKKTFEDAVISEKLRIIHAPNQNYYNASHAKNVSHVRARGAILIAADADNYIDSSYLEMCRQIFQDPNIDMVSPAPWNKFTATSGMIGRIALRREAFFALGGYDEDFIGWGGEDDDLVRRASFLGLTTRVLPHSFFKVIEHADSMRALYTPFRHKNESSLRNARMVFKKYSFGIFVANQSRSIGVLEDYSAEIT